MSNTNIANMNDKQLRNEVQLLRDELAIFKRKYEDLLYNLDDDNFSSRFVKEKGDMKTAIEITAEGLSSKVSKEEVQSEIKQAADEIKLSVTDLGQEVTSLTASTNGIESKVTNIEGGKFKGYTLFKQTGSKFSFTGNVEISGNAIVGGTIRGSTLQTLMSSEESNYGTYAELNAENGSLDLYYQPDFGDENRPNDEKEHRFSIYQSAGATYIENISSDLIIGNYVNTSTGAMNRTFPIGFWDFSDCTDVVGLDDFVGGSGGVAKFG